MLASVLGCLEGHGTISCHEAWQEDQGDVSAIPSYISPIRRSVNENAFNRYQTPYGKGIVLAFRFFCSQWNARKRHIGHIPVPFVSPERRPIPLGLPATDPDYHLTAIGLTSCPSVSSTVASGDGEERAARWTSPSSGVPRPSSIPQTTPLEAAVSPPYPPYNSNPNRRSKREHS